VGKLASDTRVFEGPPVTGWISMVVSTELGPLNFQRQNTQAFGVEEEE
jgi:hypothetical protein